MLKAHDNYTAITMKARFLRMRTDLIGSILHNVVSAMAMCDAQGERLEAVVFELSPQQKMRYGSTLRPQLEILINMFALPELTTVPPSGATEIRRSEYNEMHLTCRYPSTLLMSLRHRAPLTRDTRQHPFAVVHIRRGDIHRKRPDPRLGYSRFVDVDYFRRHIDAIRTRGVSRVVIVSEQMNSEDVQREFADCELRLAAFPEDSEATVEDWKLMATADILVLSPSSFSYVPALFNPNFVIYKPFWHAQQPGWINGDEDVAPIPA